MGKVEQRKIKKQQEEAVREEKKEFATVTAIKKELGLDALSESLKIKGLNKIGKLSLEQSFTLLKQATPTILRLTGAFKNGCPPDLINIIAVRNEVVDTVNNLTFTINSFIESVNGVGTLIQFYKSSGKALLTAKNLNSAASKVVPSPPGLPGILSSVADDLDTHLIKNDVKVEQNTQKFEYNSSFLNFTLGVLKQTKKVVTQLDFLILGCNPDAGLTSTNDLLDQLGEPELDTTYKGFTFEIVKVPFNETLDRSKAIALNKSNIPVIETELSFTLEPNVLIEQLKNRIDQENLKAD